jgi:hypothetical protein
MMPGLLAQVPPPPDNTAYAWFAVVVALALAGLFAEYIRTRNKYEDRREADLKEWKEIAQTSVKAFEANTTQLSKTNDAVESLGGVLERVESHLFNEPRRPVPRRGS